MEMRIEMGIGVKYRLEGLYALLLEVVPRQVELRVVDGETAYCAVGAAEKGLHGDDGDAVVGAVGGVLEVQLGSPVVAFRPVSQSSFFFPSRSTKWKECVPEVLGHLARCARSSGAYIPFHTCIERIPTDDVVDMRRGIRTRLNDRVEALDRQFRAGESEARLHGRNQREGCRERPHGEILFHFFTSNTR